jgi:hypothetical protein
MLVPAAVAVAVVAAPLEAQVVRRARQALPRQARLVPPAPIPREPLEARQERPEEPQERLVWQAVSPLGMLGQAPMVPLEVPNTLPAEAGVRMPRTAAPRRLRSLSSCSAWRSRFGVEGDAPLIPRTRASNALFQVA